MQTKEFLLRLMLCPSADDHVAGVIKNADIDENEAALIMKYSGRAVKFFQAQRDSIINVGFLIYAIPM
jgi:hypothetical protein